MHFVQFFFLIAFCAFVWSIWIILSQGEPGESEPNYKGEVQIVVTRGEGIYGDIAVSWSITPRDESAFLQVEGILNIVDLQQNAAITLQVDNETGIQ